MKRITGTVLGLVLCIGLLTGCGTSLESDSSIVYVDKKGAVTSIDVEDMDQGYYDETELQSFVDEAVEEYNGEYGKGSVKVDSLVVENGTAKLSMKYKTPEDYTQFNGIELYHGKVVDSLAAGYIYDGDFARVEDGKVTGSASKQEIYAEGDLKVVIIRANTNVKVDGKICYVSCENVKLTGADSVSIRDGYYLSASNGSAASAAEVAPKEHVTGTEYVPEEGNAAEQSDTSGAGEETAEDGSFETEVYTFIVYR